MPITRVSHYSDHTTVSYCLKRQIGIPDESGKLKIEHSKISSLPNYNRPAALTGYNTSAPSFAGFEERVIQIPGSNVRIVLLLITEIVSSWYSEEESLRGPFLLP